MTRGKLPLGQKLEHGIWWVLAADLLIAITVFGVQNTVTNLFLLRLGYDVTTVGRLNGISVVMYAFSALAVGAVGLPFRMRPRMAMVLGATLGQASNLMIPLALFMPPSVRTVFILSVALSRSAGLGLYTVALQPYLMAASEPAAQGKAYASWAAVGMAGGLIGSLVGGYLSDFSATLLHLTQQDAAPFALTLAILAILTAFAPALIARADDVDPKTSVQASPDPPKLSDPFPLLTILIVFLVMFLRVTPGAALYTYGSIFLDQMQNISSQRIGIVWSASMAIAVPLVLTAPTMIRRFGTDRTLFFSMLAVGVIILPIAFIKAPFGAMVTLIGFNGLTHIGRTALVLIAMRSVSFRWRTRVAGATETAAALAFLCVGFACGPVIVSWGYKPVFIGASVTSFLAVVFYLLFRRKSSDTPTQ